MVGAGYFGSRHAEKFAALPGVKLEYVVDPDRGRARGDRVEGRRAGDHRRCARCSTTSTSPPSRCPRRRIAGRARRSSAPASTSWSRSRHATLDEADALVELAAASRPGVAGRTPRALQSRHARGARRITRRASSSPTGWRLQAARIDVDVVLDLMIHDLDLILTLSTRRSPIVRGVGVPVLTAAIDIANARIEFADGCVANLTASRVSRRRCASSASSSPTAISRSTSRTARWTSARADPGATGGPDSGHHARSRSVPGGRFARGRARGVRRRGPRPRPAGGDRPGRAPRARARARDLPPHPRRRGTRTLNEAPIHQDAGRRQRLRRARRRRAARSPSTAGSCARLADRHFGVGCDQVLVVERPRAAGVDFRYRIFNADGGEVEQCGNGARCFVRFVRDRGLTAQARDPRRDALAA